MALIKCKECKKELSSNAKKCPNCGEITEYGKQLNKKMMIAIFLFVIIIGAIIVCDNTGLLKTCKEGDEKRGNTCISKHYSDALEKEECSSAGLYVKDGRCYHKMSGAQLGIPTKKYYCSSGYLDKSAYSNYQKRCIVETTYKAYYKIK